MTSAFIFGLSFILLGIAGLSAATYQHWRILEQIKQNRFDYTGFHPLVLMAAILLIIIGLRPVIGVVPSAGTARAHPDFPALHPGAGMNRSLALAALTLAAG